MDLSGAKIIITGGSSGIGKQTAKDLISKGASVIITGRDEQKLLKVALDLGCTGYHADVSSEEAAKGTVDFALEKWGSIDVLINNAGYAEFGLIHELDLSKLKAVYNTNVFGAAAMAKYCAQVFRKQKSGNIINIASTAASKGYPQGSIYATSKFALSGMTQCWRAELRPYNVRVIQINPSEVPTAFAQENRIEREQESNKLTPKEISNAIVSSLEMDNRGMITDVTVIATNPF
ncbi:MAG: short-chain dehydrogenase [Flavobacteriales bacterium]|nr:short-chain dehydrogenase [Flavobacteriales bacterium]MBO73342.1 short-chain dehydrogenase [Flavobacteriales bacterium]|tara:strand:+ start:329 stop:1030 length:702 start_codon:yes stop_codon:yes gene_type:complete